MGYRVRMRWLLCWKMCLPTSLLSGNSQHVSKQHCSTRALGELFVNPHNVSRGCYSYSEYSWGKALHSLAIWRPQDRAVCLWAHSLTFAIKILLGPCKQQCGWNTKQHSPYHITLTTDASPPFKSSYMDNMTLTTFLTHFNWVGASKIARWLRCLLPSQKTWVPSPSTSVLCPQPCGSMHMSMCPPSYRNILNK